MRLAISNIAWDAADDAAVATLLQRYRVDAIDVAPAKYFPANAPTDPADAERVRLWWRERGIEITGIQALLFGTSGLNLFAAPAVQAAMLAHLDGVCALGSRLGAPRLVFGSPRNRDRTGLSNDEADAIAVSFFRRLGDIALAHGVVICLEPNPERYGCNFMTTTADAARIVDRVAHAAIRLQLDTGALAISGEAAGPAIERYRAIIGHVHASEPGLVTLGDDSAPHAEVARALQTHLPGHVVSIEMLASTTQPTLAAIQRALHVAIRCYRPKMPAIEREARSIDSIKGHT